MIKKIIITIIWSLSISILVAQLPQDKTGDYSSGRVNTLNSNSTALDSITRPQLRILKKSLLDKSLLSEQDTSYTNAHIVEPFYRTSYYALNLGSVNSASQATPISWYNRIGLELGYDQYRPLTDQFNPYHYIDVNRSYWAVHYGKGTTINSSNLEVNFYKKFAQGIYLNFDYETHADDSWRFNQGNGIKRMELKFVQENENQKRRTYFFFQNLGIDEMHSRTMSITENASSRWSNFHMEVGNQMLLIDSLANGRSLNISNSLKIVSNRYSFSDNSISDSEAESYMPISSSAISLQNQLRSITLANRISLASPSSTIAAIIDVNSKNNRNLVDSTAISELILGIEYDRDIDPETHLSVALNYGLIDIAGELKSELKLNSRIGSIPITSELSFYRLNPTLFYQRLTIDSTVLWDNSSSFSKSTYLKASIDAIFYGINLGVDMSQVSGGIFIGPEGLPIQLDQGGVSSISLMASKDIDYRFISSSHRLIYNRINNSVLLSPKIQLNGNIKTDLYIERYNALIELGFDYYFMPSFQAPSFHPVYGKFFNDGSGTTSGNIFILNPYMSIAIDKFLFFLKSNNASYLLNSAHVAPIKDYPLYNYRIVFGVKWTLLD